MAKKIPGEFVPIDVLLPHDPAIRRAGPDAELLFIRSLIYCKHTQSDGFLPSFDLDVAAVGCRNVTKSVRRLVAERLWEERPGGWMVRSWAKWNRTNGEQKELSESKRLGAMKTNHSRYHKGEYHSDCPLCQEEARGDGAA